MKNTTGNWWCPHHFS